MERVDYFDEISDESRAYWLGFLYAECCLLQSRKQVFVLLAQRDRAHLEKLALIFDRPVYEHSSSDRRTGKTYRGARLILNGKHLWDSLNQKGFEPRKSLSENASVLDHISEDL
ncbi:MAG TPA: hypothetical protein VM890_07045, partial [Longimicrobium sp.]|nr:hypothetical protein [Longimicrobium sp.]